jgi:hypothetical protein
MVTKGPFTLGDDLPKENPWQDDRLGYRPFAERLAKVAQTLHAPNGYVIGLHGKWGSGKSTALNFVKAFLKKYNDELENEADHIHVVDFRPWIISGHQDLIAAFFKVLSESLGKKPGFISRQVNRVARFGKVTADPLLDALATVALVIDPSGGSAAKAVTSVAKKSVGGMIDRFLSEPSLQAAYQTLRKELESSGKRFLVIIDDLDRLEDAEIRTVMQMVKTIGSLPNVVYLLAYDRDVVWPVLDGEDAKTGPKFAEKIVQQELELPRPSKGALLTILDQDIQFLNEEISESETGSMRWHYIVRDGVHRWIQYPRDVLRLANGVKFSWPALQGEIDPADLLSLEGLRLFDQVAFDWVRRNRDFLFSEGAFLMSQDKEETAVVDAFKNSLPETNRQQVIKLLAVLFPLGAKHFEGKNAMGGENRAQVGARRGIGSPAGYDAYFGLHPAADAIPKTIIDAIIRKASDRRAVVTLIEPYLGVTDKSGKAVIGLVLEELRFRFYGHEHAKPAPELLQALFDIGERVLRTDSTPEAFSPSPQAQLNFLISEILECWPPAQAGDRLVEAFNNSTSATFCAAVFAERARELGKLPDSSSSQPPIEEKHLAELGKRLMTLIDAAAADGSLRIAPSHWSIVESWKYLRGPNEPKAWLSAGMVESAEFLATTTMSLVSYSLSRRDRAYSMRTRPDATLYDLEVLRSACRKHLAGTELNADQRNRVSVVADAVDRILADDKKKSEAKDAKIGS